MRDYEIIELMTSMFVYFRSIRFQLIAILFQFSTDEQRFQFDDRIAVSNHLQRPTIDVSGVHNALRRKWSLWRTFQRKWETKSPAWLTQTSTSLFSRLTFKIAPFISITLIGCDEIDHYNDRNSFKFQFWKRDIIFLLLSDIFHAYFHTCTCITFCINFTE